MKQVKILMLLVFTLALIGPPPNMAVADDQDAIVLFLGAMTATSRTASQLQANVQGASQLYTLNAAVRSVANKAGTGGVLHYRLLGKQATKGAAVGASNLIQVSADGTSSLALTATTGGVMALYTVTDPDAAHVYVALDYTDADTLALIRQLNTGLIRINLATNAVEKVAPGCVVAPIPDSYYANMQIGNKPIQFDDAGNVIFNGYQLSEGVVSAKAGLKRVAMPAMTVTALTDDSQSVQFFLALPNGDVAFQAVSSIGNSTQLMVWKPSAGEISLTNGAVTYLLKDSSKDIIYKVATASPGTVTFARSRDGGGVDRVTLPNTTPWSVVGDDGNFYGLNYDGTSGAVAVSTIMPYVAAPVLTLPVDNWVSYAWQTTPVQISKGYLYFVSRIDPGDGFGNRDTINVKRLHGSDRITILGDKRYQIYAWRQTGGYDKLYFTARDLSALSATIYSGVIDTVKLQQGLSQDQYLSLQPVASATGSAAQVKDLEILSPQIPPVNPGYEPYIADVSTGVYAEGITFSKYMNIASVEANLQFTVRDGGTVPALPVWFLSSLYLVPDLDGLGNAATTPLDPAVCYSLAMTADNILDYWNVRLWDKYGFLPIAIGTACEAVTCSYTLNKSALTFEATGGNQSVAVATNADTCAWGSQIPSDAAAWLSATASGTGSGTASVTASANTATTARSATIQIAGQDVLVTQAGSTPICTFTVSPMTVAEPAAGGSATLTVTASDQRCAWSTSESLDWLTVSSGASGTGNGSVVLTVAANTATASRNGSLQVAGKTVTLSQLGANPNVIVFAARESAQGDRHLWTMDPDGTNRSVISGSLAGDADPQLSPDGKTIGFLRTVGTSSIARPDLFVMDYDGANRKQLTARGELTNDQERGVNTFGWYPDNTSLIMEVGYSAIEEKIYKTYTNGAAESLVFNNASDKDTSPIVNPVNDRLVYFIYDSGNWTPNRQIREYNLDTVQQRVLFAANNLSDFHLRASKDGTQLVWVEEKTYLQGDFQLRLMNADGTNVRTLSIAGISRITDPDFSPDGTRLVFIADDRHVWTVGVDGSNPVQLTNDLWASSPSWGTKPTP